MTDRKKLQAQTKSALIEKIEALEREMSDQRGGNSPISATDGLIDALNRVDDGVVLYDADDSLVFVNPAYLKRLPEDLKALYVPGASFTVKTNQEILVRHPTFNDDATKWRFFIRHPFISSWILLLNEVDTDAT